MLCTGLDETDIDDVQESDIDTSMVVETKENKRPISLFVTDLDSVREDLKELPPPLLPTTTTHGVVCLVFSTFVFFSRREQSL